MQLLGFRNNLFQFWFWIHLQIQIQIQLQLQLRIQLQLQLQNGFSLNHGLASAVGHASPLVAAAVIAVDDLVMPAPPTLGDIVIFVILLYTTAQL